MEGKKSKKNKIQDIHKTVWTNMSFFLNSLFEKLKLFENVTYSNYTGQKLFTDAVLSVNLSLFSIDFPCMRKKYVNIK